jgi:5-(carboxyamino)imidazole ribonucleotide synthase
VTDLPFPPLLPGATIGIVGGGQLGRMTAQSAARMGYRVHIFTPEQDSPAAQVSPAVTIAAYDDTDALARFARSVDVATFEFENVPAATAKALADLVPLRPGVLSLEVAQDRIREKTFLNANGGPTAPFEPVNSAEDLARALEKIGRPAVLKTATLGYDGKGQVMIGPETDVEEAYAAMGATRGVLEGFVDFDSEISVILARQDAHRIVAFEPVENRHKNHILDTTIAPAPITPELAHQAVAIAEAIAQGLDLIGLLAVELFVTNDDRILVNEIAPRPHNSGHWSIDACVTSQFEQFVRAICGLPLGNPSRHSNAVMRNLIGDDVNDINELIADPDVKIHLYGKKEARPGRKMGHATKLYPLEAKGPPPKVPFFGM